MRWRATCPSCGMRVSRGDIFWPTTIYHRCRGCGAILTATLVGNINGFLFLLTAIISFGLYRFGILPRLVCLVLLVGTLGLAIWLAPYVTPARLTGPKPDSPTKREDGATKS